MAIWWEFGHTIHYPSFTSSNCPTSQGKLRKGETGAGVELQVGDLHILLEVVSMAFWLGAQKMVEASKEGRFLTKVLLSSGKTKATAILSWYLYGQCSGSSRNKHPQVFFFFFLV